MSGPKTSGYVLTPEQRKRIQELQRIIRETKIAQDRRNFAMRQAKACLKSLDSILGEFERFCKESGQGKTDLEDIKIVCNDFYVSVNNSKYQAEGLDLKAYQEQINRLDDCILKIRTELAKTKQVLAKMKAKYKSGLEEIIENGFILDFSGMGETRKYKENASIKKINNMLEQIIYDELPNNLKEKLIVLQKRAAEITNIDFLENFYSMQVVPFVNECKRYQECGKEYEYLLRKYMILAEEAGEKKKNYEFSMPVIEGLKQEIGILEDKILRAQEQEYISESIDEAMREMGYELIGNRSVVKKSGKKFKNELYKFGEGTAVNVTFADNGQISMELGVMDATNRIPDEREAEELVSDMKAFCSDYLRLERKLEQKGIISRRISALPPVPEYAQIFDISDYEMIKNTEILKKQEKNRKREVRRERIYKEG